ncbi:MAG TPA: leucyl aminopeptidase [Longimicrobiales bacterium]
MVNLEIEVIQAQATEVATPLLVLPHFEGEAEPTGAAAEVDGRTGGEIARLLGRGDFRGKRDEALVLYPRTGEVAAERLLLVGLGKAGDVTAEVVRRALGTAVRQAERIGAAALALSLDAFDRVADRLAGEAAAQAAAEGAVLAAWQYREFKSAPPDEAPRVEVTSLTLVARDAGAAETAGRGARRGAVVARGENLARELASSPGNVATPTHLAEVASRIARDHGMKITVLDREAMRREGMGALLAVAQGSEEEPRFIALEYRGAEGGDGPLALVGKGVTFDTGGISIKPASGMEDMKFDMSGAAAVLGAMQAIAELRLPAHVVALVPSTENMPSGRAVKPGDIIRAHSGKTIEVVNTDAEGRLILADALSYAQRYRPRAIVDAATLTGACVVALGNHAVGLMGNDESLIDEVRAAGERTGERCWPLPLWEPYRRQLDSEYADLKNTGGRPAGTITAGWFLREFVGDVPWVHLDIAGTAYGDAPPPYLRKGSTGVPTRLFVDWVRERAGQ